MKLKKNVEGILAVIPTAVAILLQVYFWSYVQPFVWLFFYPAVFFSAWIGGFLYGFVSTIISTLVAFAFFLSPDYPFSLTNFKVYLNLIIFLFMGTLISILLGRLKKINQLLASEMRQKDIYHAKDQELLEQLANIVEFSEDAIIGKDLNGIIVSWNRGAEKIFQYSAKEMIGKSILLLVPLDRREEEVSIIKSIMAGENISQYETVRLKKDQTLVDVSVTISAIKNSTGQVIGISKVIRDITKRKKAEEEIHRLNIDLENRVIQRTEQLENANKELEAFSYSISHDLRSPLRAINGYTNILLEDYEPNLDSEGKRICNIIRNEAKRMGELIDDLLSFSRLNRTEMQDSVVDMKAMAKETFEELIALEKRDRIEFRLSELPKAVCDASLIRQVWINLLSNAIKFTSKKDLAIIEVQGIETKETNIYSVIDNGVGFDMRYSNKLFGVFQRLHNESEFEGTGVGLAIIKRAVERNGGSVYAEGEINKGAKVSFALPRKGNENE